MIDKIPVVVGVHLPLEFREKVFEEKRERGGEYSIGLGKAQSAGFMRILTAMFNRVVVVDSPAAREQRTRRFAACSSRRSTIMRS